MRWVLAAVWLVSCGDPPPVRSPAPPPAAEPAPAAAPVDPAPATPANAIPEIEARVILARMFRDAGFRVVYDVPVTLGATTVAVDGFDPEAGVGFEYRAREELAAWSGEIAGDSELQILVVDAADRDTVEARARAFLAAVKRPTQTE